MAQAAADATDKVPRTERGRKTRRVLLDAAAAEFATDGFHLASVSAITRRAGVALGSFYTYFDSKDAIFRALVSDMSEQVRDHVAPSIRAALESFLTFVRAHKEIYRIIDEAEFVYPASFRRHYATTADRIAQRLREAAGRGEVRPDVEEVHAWAVMGMNVFLGLRYGPWDEDRGADEVAGVVADFLRRG